MHQHHVQQAHHPTHVPQNGYANNVPHAQNALPNGSTQNGSQAHRNPSQHGPRETINVLGIPSVTVEGDQLVVGGSQSNSVRSYTPLKVVGDGSFGTVWLCDWHGTLPPNTPVSAMQCGAGARPEYAGKRLVAVKRMKKRWDGGWDECKRLKELESLRAIPYHPNIIPLYDFFLLPETKELYFVFESMEGNLYQLIKTRKGKPLAGGLVSSIFRQVVQGLHHIHSSGYFHRDMKPENLLVTTTGLYDYRPVHPDAPPNAPPEKDVVVIIKLADFGLARETNSAPPYTEYVSTRWYRAPEVLLKSRDYSNPVDMWALGTIMAELVNLRPLFPGQTEIDQVARICELLGDPVEDYGVDQRGKPLGGGQWPRGVRMARNIGFQFPKAQPRNVYSLFEPTVPISLVECIVDLLKYDPEIRLTSQQCLEHPYLQQTTHLNSPPSPPTQPRQTQGAVSCRVEARRGALNGIHSNTNSNVSLPSIAPRNIPPSHSHPNGNPKMHPPAIQIPPTHIPGASSTHRSSFYDSGFASAHSRTLSESSRQPSEYSGDLVYSPRDGRMYADGADRVSGWLQQGQAHAANWDAMDVSPQVDPSAQAQYVTSSHHPMDIQTSPMAQEYPARPPVEPEPIQASAPSHGQGNKFSKLSSLGFGKKQGSKWGLSMFGGHGDKSHQQPLPPVQESSVASASTPPSLKRRESSSTDSRSLSEISPAVDLPRPPPQHFNNAEDSKQRKKEAKEVQKEAERQRRLRAEKMQREQARAVMKNNRRLAQVARYNEPEWMSGPHGGRVAFVDKGKQPASSGPGPIRQAQQNYGASTLTINAASGSYAGSTTSPVISSAQETSSARTDWQRENGRVAKARRRDYDDDHSMSSDLHGRTSMLSLATVDSDPGPGRMNRLGAQTMNRMHSVNSLRSSADDFSTSGRSSTSFSLEQQLANDFHLRASVDSSSISDGGSPQPPAMHMLSLSSPIPWQNSHSDLSGTSTVDNRSIGSSRQHQLSSPLSPPPQPRHPGLHLGPHSPFDNAGGVYAPPSPSMAPKSAINPIFKVPPFSSSPERPTLSLTTLPPFSQLEAVADGGEYPPLSPMSFTIPEEDVSGEDS
ncbi:Pkinase-domain-containing protein [Phanerochaete sordida]|uniref:Pkinase-domain-containing protein n=1 Tax=Phanerochaete sordida TaxID=48140 RepID=A0A9P3G0U1_9APHY|nr:Pkinase-domain-containing protein [Phanerochaete sordida]